MSNPKMMDLTQQIMSDPATMKKVMALYSSQAQAQALPLKQHPLRQNPPLQVHLIKYINFFIWHVTPSYLDSIFLVTP